MSKDTARIPSGFPMLDILTGGYPATGIVIARYLGHEMQAEILQDFMERQAFNFALKKSMPCRKTLMTTLQMSQEELLATIKDKLAESVTIRGEQVDIETLADILTSQLYISTLEKDQPLPTADVYIEYLEKYVAEMNIEALVVDAIDLLIPERKACGNPVTNAIENGFSNIVSEKLENGLLGIAEKHRIPVIVTDYENRFMTVSQLSDGIMQLELNQDVNGTVQATASTASGLTRIEDLFGIPEHLGAELVRAAVSHYNQYGSFPESTDRVQALANAGAAIVLQIDDLLKSLQP